MAIQMKNHEPIFIYHSNFHPYSTGISYLRATLETVQTVLESILLSLAPLRVRLTREREVKTGHPQTSKIKSFAVKWSNALKQFVGCCRRIVLVRLTISLQMSQSCF